MIESSRAPRAARPRRELLSLIAAALLAPTSTRAGVIQMTFARDAGWHAVETCPQLELNLDSVLETSVNGDQVEAPCGCERDNVGRNTMSIFPGDGRWSSIPSMISINPRNMATFQSTFTSMSLLAMAAAGICFLYLLFVGVTKSRALKKTMRPAMGVAKQWASDLSDVFVVFPCKGFQYLLRLIVVVPVQGIHGFGLSIHTAWKTRLQQQLLEEAEKLAEDCHPKPKTAKQSDRGVVSGSSSPGATPIVRKGKQKVGLAPVPETRTPVASSRGFRSPESGGSPVSPSASDQRRHIANATEELSLGHESDEKIAKRPSSSSAEAPDSDLPEESGEVAVTAGGPAADEQVPQVAPQKCPLATPKRKPAAVAASDAASKVGPGRAAVPKAAKAAVTTPSRPTQPVAEPSPEAPRAKGTAGAAVSETSSVAADKPSAPKSQEEPGTDGGAWLQVTKGSTGGSSASTAKAVEAPSPATQPAVGKVHANSGEEAKTAPQRGRIASTGSSSTQKSDEATPKSKLAAGSTGSSVSAPAPAAKKDAAPQATETDATEESAPPSMPPPPPPQSAAKGATAAKAKVAPPPFPPPGLPAASATPPGTDSMPATKLQVPKVPPPTAKPGAAQAVGSAPQSQPQPQKTVGAQPEPAKTRRMLGPPPSGPAPPPPPVPGSPVAVPVETEVKAEVKPEPKPLLQELGLHEDPSAAKSKWEKKPQPAANFVELMGKAVAKSFVGKDVAELMGGTGGTIDFGKAGEKVIEKVGKIAQVAQAKAINAQVKGKDKSKPLGLAPSKKGPLEALQDEDAREAAKLPPGLAAPPGKGQYDMFGGFGLDMEDMVANMVDEEELAGVNPFTRGGAAHPAPPGFAPPSFPPPEFAPPEFVPQTSQELLTDWDTIDVDFSRYDAEDTPQAWLGGAEETPADTDLRVSAPVFVPGQQWTGAQISSFID